jgi:hypothetical protein
MRHPELNRSGYLIKRLPTRSHELHRDSEERSGRVLLRRAIPETRPPMGTAEGDPCRAEQYVALLPTVAGLHLGSHPISRSRVIATGQLPTLPRPKIGRLIHGGAGHKQRRPAFGFAFWSWAVPRADRHSESQAERPAPDCGRRQTSPGVGTPHIPYRSSVARRWSNDGIEKRISKSFEAGVRRFTPKGIK